MIRVQPQPQDLHMQQPPAPAPVIYVQQQPPPHELHVQQPPAPVIHVQQHPPPPPVMHVHQHPAHQVFTTLPSLSPYMSNPSIQTHWSFFSAPPERAWQYVTPVAQ